MLFKSSVDNQYGDYNVAQVGGAVGIYHTGIFIPRFSQSIFIRFVQNINFVSVGHTATISVGISIQGVGDFPTFLAPAVVIETPLPLVWNGPDKVFPTFEIIVGVGVEDFTAGQLMIYAEYFNTDY